MSTDISDFANLNQYAFFSDSVTGLTGSTLHAIGGYVHYNTKENSLFKVKATADENTTHVSNALSELNTLISNVEALPVNTNRNLLGGSGQVTYTIDPGVIKFFGEDVREITIFNFRNINNLPDPKYVIIFNSSITTQDYAFQFLNNTGIPKKNIIVLFRGQVTFKNFSDSFKGILLSSHVPPSGSALTIQSYQENNPVLMYNCNIFAVNQTSFFSETLLDAGGSVSVGPEPSCDITGQEFSNLNRYAFFTDIVSGVYDSALHVKGGYYHYNTNETEFFTVKGSLDNDAAHVSSANNELELLISRVDNLAANRYFVVLTGTQTFNIEPGVSVFLVKNPVFNMNSTFNFTNTNNAVNPSYILLFYNTISGDVRFTFTGNNNIPKNKIVVLAKEYFELHMLENSFKGIFISSFVSEQVNDVVLEGPGSLLTTESKVFVLRKISINKSGLTVIDGGETMVIEEPPHNIAGPQFTNLNKYVFFTDIVSASYNPSTVKVFGGYYHYNTNESNFLTVNGSPDNDESNVANATNELSLLASNVLNKTVDRYYVFSSASVQAFNVEPGVTLFMNNSLSSIDVTFTFTNTLNVPNPTYVIINFSYLSNGTYAFVGTANIPRNNIIFLSRKPIYFNVKDNSFRGIFIGLKVNAVTSNAYAFGSTDDQLTLESKLFFTSQVHFYSNDSVVNGGGNVNTCVDVTLYPYCNLCTFYANSFYSASPVYITNVQNGDYHVASYSGEQAVIIGSSLDPAYVGNFLSEVSIVRDFFDTLDVDVDLSPTNGETINVSPSVMRIAGNLNNTTFTFKFKNVRQNNYYIFLFSGDIANCSINFLNHQRIDPKKIIFYFTGTVHVPFVPRGIIFSTGHLFLGNDPTASYSLNGKIFALDELSNENTVNVILDGSVECVAEGTKIETPTGPVCVEELRIGDEVVLRGTIFENKTFVEKPTEKKKIIWIGNFSVNTAKTKYAPIKFQKGALGNDLPTEDLYVSRNHGIVVDGKLVPAWKLKNDSTIDHDHSRENIRYYHIEMEEHSALVAHGVLVESYLDTGNRGTMTSLQRGPINKSI
jgi:hypothetical protein